MICSGIDPCSAHDSLEQDLVFKQNQSKGLTWTLTWTLTLTFEFLETGKRLKVKRIHLVWISMNANSVQTMTIDGHTSFTHFQGLPTTLELSHQFPGYKVDLDQWSSIQSTDCLQERNSFDWNCFYSGRWWYEETRRLTSYRVRRWRVNIGHLVSIDHNVKACNSFKYHVVLDSLKKGWTQKSLLEKNQIPISCSK